MSARRRSRLDVVARLARLNERRELGALGEAQRHTRSWQDRVSALDASIVSTSASAALPAGAEADAAQLVAHQRTLVALRARDAAARIELLDAGRKEDEARERMIQARARVRGIERAMDKRRAREARRQRRAEQRRIDELVRGLEALRAQEGAS